MQTPAIGTMALTVAELLADATKTATAAAAVVSPDRQNELIGTILPVRDQLRTAVRLLEAMVELHRLYIGPMED